MSEQMPPQYNSERYFQPQAIYPAQPNPYGPPQQTPGYPPRDGMPQHYQQAQQMYPYPQPGPQYQAPVQGPYAQPFNININNIQNGYAESYDPYRSNAVTALTCGIVAVLIWLVPFIGTLASLICAIVALVNGIKGRRSTTRAGSATAGIVLSIIAFVILLVGVILIFSIFVLAAASSTRH